MFPNMFSFQRNKQTHQQTNKQTPQQTNKQKTMLNESLTRKAASQSKQPLSLLDEKKQGEPNPGPNLVQLQSTERRSFNMFKYTILLF